MLGIKGCINSIHCHLITTSFGNMMLLLQDLILYVYFLLKLRAGAAGSEVQGMEGDPLNESAPSAGETGKGEECPHIQFPRCARHCGRGFTVCNHTKPYTARIQMHWTDVEVAWRAGDFSRRHR